MAYTPDISIDADVALVGGDFNNPGDWTASVGITVGGGVAAYGQTAPFIETCSQANADFISNNLYEITFTIANANFAAGSSGARWTIGGGALSVANKTNGTFSILVTAGGLNNQILFQFTTFDPLDSCDISNASIIPLSNITEEVLEIKAQVPQAAVDYQVPGEGNRHVILSWKDKTNCIVKYEL